MFSVAVGKDLTAVQNLLKKHQALMVNAYNLITMSITTLSIRHACNSCQLQGCRQLLYSGGAKLYAKCARNFCRTHFQYNCCSYMVDHVAAVVWW